MRRLCWGIVLEGAFSSTLQWLVDSIFKVVIVGGREKLRQGTPFRFSWKINPESVTRNQFTDIFKEQSAQMVCSVCATPESYSYTNKIFFWNISSRCQNLFFFFFYQSCPLCAMCLQISDVLHLGFIGKQELFYSIFLNKDTECCKKKSSKTWHCKKEHTCSLPHKARVSALVAQNHNYIRAHGLVTDR